MSMDHLRALILRHPNSCIELAIVVAHNNPISPHWCSLVLRNNPEAVRPKLNPEQYDEMITLINADAWVAKRRQYLLRTT